jgi:regulator of replication initiation timing
MHDGSSNMKSEMEAISAENKALKAKNEELSKAPASPAASFKKFEKNEIAAKPASFLDR